MAKKRKELQIYSTCAITSVVFNNKHKKQKTPSSSLRLPTPNAPHVALNKSDKNKSHDTNKKKEKMHVINPLHALEGHSLEVSLQVRRAPRASHQALDLSHGVLKVAAGDACGPLAHEPLLPLERHLADKDAVRAQRKITT